MTLQELKVLRGNNKVFHADGNPDNNIQIVDTGTIDVERQANGGYWITVSHFRSNPGMTHRKTGDYSRIINRLDVSDEDAALMAESIIVDYCTINPDRASSVIQRIMAKIEANKQHRALAIDHAKKAGFALTFPDE